MTFGGGIRARGFEEVRVRVIEEVCTQQTVGSPYLDGALGDAEPLSGFIDGEHAGLAQARVAALQAVPHAELPQEVAIEGPALPRAKPSGVQQAGDLPHGVTVEQPVDLGNDLRRGSSIPGSHPGAEARRAWWRRRL